MSQTDDEILNIIYASLDEESSFYFETLLATKHLAIDDLTYLLDLTDASLKERHRILKDLEAGRETAGTLAYKKAAVKQDEAYVQCLRKSVADIDAVLSKEWPEALKQPEVIEYLKRSAFPALAAIAERAMAQQPVPEKPRAKACGKCSQCTCKKPKLN